MKYIDSIFTPAMSGKIGNIVFSSNHYGPYSCQRKIPVDHKTPEQLNVRAGTAAIARAWAKLSDAQRSQWRKEADNYPFQKKGKKYFLTGFALFMKLNRNLYEVSQPIMTNPPVGKNIQPQVFSLFSVKIVNTPSGKDLLLFINPAINANSNIKLFATMPLKTSELFGTHKYYKIAVLDSSFVSGTSIKDLYIKKYNQFISKNSKAFFVIKSTNINSGFDSTIISSEVYGI